MLNVLLFSSSILIRIPTLINRQVMFRMHFSIGQTKRRQNRIRYTCCFVVSCINVKRIENYTKGVENGEFQSAFTSWKIEKERRIIATRLSDVTRQQVAYTVFQSTASDCHLTRYSPAGKLLKLSSRKEFLLETPSLFFSFTCIAFKLGTRVTDTMANSLWISDYLRLLLYSLVLHP